MSPGHCLFQFLIFLKLLTVIVSFLWKYHNLQLALTSLKGPQRQPSTVCFYHHWKGGESPTGWACSPPFIYSHPLLPDFLVQVKTRKCFNNENVWYSAIFRQSKLNWTAEKRLLWPVLFEHFQPHSFVKVNHTQGSRAAKGDTQERCAQRTWTFFSKSLLRVAFPFKS